MCLPNLNTVAVGSSARFSASAGLLMASYVLQVQPRISQLVHRIRDHTEEDITGLQSRVRESVSFAQSRGLSKLVIDTDEPWSDAVAVANAMPVVLYGWLRVEFRY